VVCGVTEGVIGIGKSFLVGMHDLNGRRDDEKAIDANAVGFGKDDFFSV
jgi:hypothetical protein